MKKDERRKIIIFLVVVFLCLFYLKEKATYTSYSSEASGEADAKIASWNISLDGQKITTKEMQDITINDIHWDKSNVREGKAAPGSQGVMKIEIDPGDTDVAIKYDLEVIDKNVDENMILRVLNIVQSDVELIKTGINKYSAVLTLDMINKKVKPVVQLDLIWENDDNINDLDKNFDLDNFLKINFTAVQYRGEEIIAYTE